jgi:hypothetical protein
LPLRAGSFAFAAAPNTVEQGLYQWENIEVSHQLYKNFFAPSGLLAKSYRCAELCRD